MSDLDKNKIREWAEQDLEKFIKLVHPHRLLGDIHREVIRWWNRENAKSHQLLLLPRDHGKSAMIAYRVAWEITRNPTIRVLYISSTSNLAVKQVKFIKDILTSDIYRRYWPEMVHPDEAKREKWAESEFSVDHPLRKKEAVRDPTVFTAGLTTSITGLHCDIAVLDDVVVKENVYTEEGREKVEEQYSLLSSIEAADAREWVVGTRYHPKDLYYRLSTMAMDIFDSNGNVIGEEPLYEKFERQVEDEGDGSGKYLWPRARREDGRWFGFNRAILAKKKAQYLDKIQFRAQYYNDPNDYEGSGIKRDYFQYYNPAFINRSGNYWYYRDNRLNLFAAVDFAWSLNKKADYTAITVVGVDSKLNYYVLDIDRFKANLPSEYFRRILLLYQKWGFNKLRAEITAAQEVIVRDLKESYIKPYGISLSIDEYRPSRQEGTKAERVFNILQPKYTNRQVWHFQGGNINILEEELLLSHPPHDDVKDCLAAAIDVAVAPSMSFFTNIKNVIHPRFGGIN